VKWNKGANCGETSEAPLVASGNLYEIGVLGDDGDGEGSERKFKLSTNR
jgi:hypothetical protein